MQLWYRYIILRFANEFRFWEDQAAQSTLPFVYLLYPAATTFAITAASVALLA
jgi:hypothetical protein